jgi:hypothetical protein
MPRHRRTLALLALAALSSPVWSAPAPSQDPEIREDFAEFARQYPRFASPVASDDFRHPAEVEMIHTLMTENPGIRDQVDAVKTDQLRQVREKTRMYRLHAIEVGPGQFPEIHQAAADAAAVLGLHDDFSVVVTNNAEMREDVMGIPRHGHIGNSFGPFTIVLTSGLVKALSPAELRFVLGRQLGHVKANHRFYTNVAFAWQQESNKLPKLFADEEHVAAEGLGGTMQLFFERGPAARRISEFSADRAGLLVVQDLDVALSVISKMAMGDLEDQDGFSLEGYLEQLKQAAAAIRPGEIDKVVAEQGFMPYHLTRVGELAAYSKSDSYRRTLGQITDQPFHLELEVQERIEASRRYYQGQLERFRSSPRYVRIDPLAKQAIEAGLNGHVSDREEASGALAALIVEHVAEAGLATPNPHFDDLDAHVRARQDARAFAGVLAELADRVRFALAQPDLTPDARAELEAKLASVQEVKDLAPPPPAEEPSTDEPTGRDWFEDDDLPAVFNETIDRLQAASGGSKKEFLAALRAMSPELKDRAKALLAQFTRQEKGEMAQLMSAQGGRIAEAVGRVLAAGDDPARLDSLYDEYFEVAVGYLKWVPMFVIRSRLARVAKLDV